MCFILKEKEKKTKILSFLYIIWDTIFQRETLFYTKFIIHKIYVNISLSKNRNFEAAYILKVKLESYSYLFMSIVMRVQGLRDGGVLLLLESFQKYHEQKKIC